MMNSIINQLPKMLSGNELTNALSVLPAYDESIREQSETERLIALSDLYDIYIPSDMSREIYSKLYLALIRSLQKKQTKAATVQQNANYRAIQQQGGSSVIGGSDSFSITGCSGLGKSRAISRAINLITAERIIETAEPYAKIIPCVMVQCPFDCSPRSLLLEILRKVDEILDTNYYSKALKVRATVDMLIGTVSQVALNSLGMIIVDEIQNIVTNKNGHSLVGMLTQLINSSGVSLALIGTEESRIFFESVMQIARRSLGLQYNSLDYNQYFYDLCCTLFSYQYVKQRTEISDAIIHWLYDHSNGIVSVVVSLIHDAQEQSILNGKEILNLETLNIAYKTRLSMLHTHIESTIKRRKQTSTKNPPAPICEPIEEVTDTDGISISALVAKAKAEQLDIVALFRENFTVEVIKI